MIILAFALAAAELCRVSGERFIMSRGLRIRCLSPLSPEQTEMVVGHHHKHQNGDVELLAYVTTLQPWHSLRLARPCVTSCTVPVYGSRQGLLGVSRLTTRCFSRRGFPVFGRQRACCDGVDPGAKGRERTVDLADQRFFNNSGPGPGSSLTLAASCER